MSQSCQIRFATETDIPLIVDFIKRLAEYEKLAHEVQVTEEILQANLFGDKRHAEVLLAYEGDVAVGFALFFHNFSTFLGKPGIYLEDLYVNPEHRGKGYGKQLLSTLAKLALDRGCGRFEWWVLDWNKPSIDFYQSLGAEPMDEWTTFRVTGNNLIKLAEECSNEITS